MRGGRECGEEEGENCIAAGEEEGQGGYVYVRGGRECGRGGGRELHCCR